jgi:2-methylcitrate dehydratase
MNLDRRIMLAGLAATAATPGFAQSVSAPGKIAPQKIALARRLADYATSVQFAELDAATTERAKVHLFDSLGCAIAAFREGPVSKIRELAFASGGDAATVIGTKRRASLEWTVFANGAGIRADDINDFYVGRQTAHPSDNIAACMGCAEVAGASGADFLLSIVLAYEIECRFLDSGYLDSRGWDHPTFALISGALAAGRLMKLSPSQLTEAVNLALSGHLPMNQTRLGTLSNWKGLAGPEAARAAVFAVQLAHAGITGPSPIFEGEAGFFKQVTGPLNIAPDKFGGRGTPFKINQCFIKSYPAQAQTQTAIVAAAKLARSLGDLSRIRAIEVKSTHMGWLMTGSTPERWAPTTSETADHSLPFIVARSMLDGTITPASYAPASLRDPKAAALMRLLTVREDPALNALLPRQSPNVISATLDDGRIVSERVDDLPGFAARPMQRADAEAKFARNAQGMATSTQITRIADAVWNLDRSDSLARLIDSMAIAA